jgi:hypothetical protein
MRLITEKSHDPGCDVDTTNSSRERLLLQINAYAISKAYRLTLQIPACVTIAPARMRSPSSVSSTG